MAAHSAAGFKFRRAWAELDPGLRRALVAGGADTAAGLARITDGTWQDALEAVRELATPGAAGAERGPPDAERLREAQWAGELLLLQDVASGAAAADGAEFAARRAEDIEAAHELLLRDGPGELEQAARLETRKRALSYAPPAPPRRRRRLATDLELEEEAGPAARETAEERRRAQQIEALAELLREAEAPVVQVSLAAAKPERVLAAAAGGRRARTLEKWLGAWRRYRAWLMAEAGYPFPRRPTDLIDYLVMRAEEPCGRTTLVAVRGLFQVMEEMAGTPEEDRLSKMPAVMRVGEDLLASLPQRIRSGGGEAPRYARAHVIAFERIVVDPEAPLFQRLYACWKLMSVWAALRFDDHRGCGTGALHMSTRGLEGGLSRTKTTGQGKRVALRPVMISKCAYIAEPDWLSTGWVLWAQAAPDHRDYFLRPPVAGLGSLEAREMMYPEAAQATRAVHRYLCGPGGRPLLPSAQAAAYWTEHSPRNFLPSAAALLQYPPDWVDGIGCWSPSTSKGYVRTVQARAKLMQDGVAAALREPGAHERFDDGSVVDQLIAHLEARGANEEEIDMQRGVLHVACCEEVERPVEDDEGGGSEHDDKTVLPSPSESFDSDEELGRAATTSPGWTAGHEPSSEPSRTMIAAETGPSDALLSGSGTGGYEPRSDLCPSTVAAIPGPADALLSGSGSASSVMPCSPAARFATPVPADALLGGSRYASHVMPCSRTARVANPGSADALLSGSRYASHVMPCSRAARRKGSSHDALLVEAAPGPVDALLDGIAGVGGFEPRSSLQHQEPDNLGRALLHAGSGSADLGTPRVMVQQDEERFGDSVVPEPGSPTRTARGQAFPFPPPFPGELAGAGGRGVPLGDAFAGMVAEYEPEEISSREKAQEELAGEAPPTPTRSEVAEEELRREAAAQVTAPPEEEEPFLPKTEQGFVTSVSRQGWRRLHYLGGCSRIPGIHYLNFNFLGEAVPGIEDYDDVCKQCWGPKGAGPKLQPEEEGVEDLSSPETSEAEGA